MTVAMTAGSDTPVAVVGGGVIGLACAARLATAGTAVLLVGGKDAAPPAAPAADDARWDPRTYALNGLACDFLEQLGVVPQLVRHGVFEALDVWDARGGRMYFSATDLGEPRLGIVVEHAVLAAALWEVLAPFRQFEHLAKELAAVDFPSRPGGVCRLRFADGESRAVRFVIGADGARSLVREQAGIKWTRRDYRQVAQAAVVETRDDHHNTCRQQFSQQGIAALLPLAQRTSAAIWSHSVASSPADFERFFSDEMGLGPVEVLAPPVAFPLHGGLARSYIAPHCLLVGDAAHSVHPLAGQGANLGFGDLTALFGALHRSRSNDFTWPVLRRYQRAVVAHNCSMKSSIEFLLGLNQVRAAAALRRTAYNGVNRSVTLKKCFMRYAAGTHLTG